MKKVIIALYPCVTTQHADRPFYIVENGEAEEIIENFMMLKPEDKLLFNYIISTREEATVAYKMQDIRAVLVVPPSVNYNA